MNSDIIRSPIRGIVMIKKQISNQSFIYVMMGYSIIYPKALYYASLTKKNKSRLDYVASRYLN